MQVLDIHQLAPNLTVWVTDEKNGLPLEGVFVVISEEGGEELDGVTDSVGMAFFDELDKTTTYRLNLTLYESVSMRKSRIINSMAFNRYFPATKTQMPRPWTFRVHC
jgi:hypothetical protein